MVKKLRVYFFQYLVVVFIIINYPFSARARVSSENVWLDLGQSLKQGIESILKDPLFRNVAVGIVIQSVDENEPLYALNPYKPLIPASAIKIVPSIVALEKLGPDYRFKTPIMTDGTIKDSTLFGNLYFIGRGDPALLHSDIDKAVAEIKALGINKIEGNIVYDVSFFDEEKNRFAPLARNLYAPPCALSVDYNSIELVLKDDQFNPQLGLMHKTSYASLHCDIRLSPSNKPGRPQMTYQEFPSGDHYFISGVISRWERKYHYLCLGVSRPGLYAATLLHESCSSAGIEILGSIKQESAPEGLALLTEIESIPLRKIIQIMNQESNNVIAAVLTKNLGALFISQPGTRDMGIAVIKGYCSDTIGIPFHEIMMKDSYGLSDNNRILATHFIKVLNCVYLNTNKEIRDLFIASLSRQHALVDNISLYLKSGTLSVRGVDTVVGYIKMNTIDKVFSLAIVTNRLQPGPMTYSGTLTDPILQSIKDIFEKGY
ncbi:MAG: D-alanyl-D-alanine carboxypeptidase/D-alanyl-D-alanine-endopeptidase [bacterium]